MNFVSLAAGGNFAFAANHGYAGGVAVFIYVNAKRSCFLDGESQVRSVDFVKVALAKFANAEIDATLRKSHLGDALVEVQEG